MRKVICFLCLCLIFNFVNAQNSFNIIGKDKSVSMHFKLVNNLILLPIEFNGNELTFILDTGVSKSLLFNVKASDSIQLNQTKKIKIKGLGIGNYYDALKSSNNLFRLRDIVSPNFDIFLILNKKFDFSARMGTNIHGLIGTDFLKNFIVEINYIKKKITFTNPEYFKYRKCKKCSEFELMFQNRKPYINAYINNDDGELIDIKLLIDSGSGEALWLFENSDERIKIPQKNFNDFLGKGLSGNIFGKKAKIKSFKLSNFSLNNMIASYPDSTSLFYLNKNLNRNGSLGAEILKRFHVILDYPNKKITLRKNGNFKKPFFYDKSGLEVIHNGKMLVQETKVISAFNTQSDNSPILSFAYNYAFKNSYLISLVKPNSPAAIVGLKEDDIILEINGKPVFEFSLQHLIQILASDQGDRVKLLVDRNGFQYTFKFILKDML